MNCNKLPDSEYPRHDRVLRCCNKLPERYWFFCFEEEDCEEHGMFSDCDCRLVMHKSPRYLPYMLTGCRVGSHGDNRDYVQDQRVNPSVRGELNWEYMRWRAKHCEPIFAACSETVSEPMLAWELRIVCNPLRIDGKKISRNAACVCGSGKKYKRCCLC